VRSTTAFLVICVFLYFLITVCSLLAGITVSHYCKHVNESEVYGVTYMFYWRHLLTLSVTIFKFEL